MDGVDTEHHTRTHIYIALSTICLSTWVMKTNTTYRPMLFFGERKGATRSRGKARQGKARQGKARRGKQQVKKSTEELLQAHDTKAKYHKKRVSSVNSLYVDQNTIDRENRESMNLNRHMWTEMHSET